MQSQENKNSNVKVHTPDIAKEKKKELTVTFFVGGKQVDGLTDEQLDRMAERLSKTMSRYYSSHLDEFKRI